MQKAIFIDGASLEFMRRDLNLRGGRLNYPGLLEVLTKKVGGTVESLPPVMTIHPEAAKKLGKLLRIAGYKLIETTSIGSKDDEAIQTRILALDDRVSEIVIVTSDSDFIPQLRQRKVRAKIIWVATRAIRISATRGSLGANIEHGISKGEFEFVELNDFRHDLYYQPPKPLAGAGTRLILEAAQVDILPRFISEIAEVLARYNGKVHYYLEDLEPQAVPATTVGRDKIGNGLRLSRRRPAP